MKRYKCIKDYSCHIFDDDGCYTDKIMKIKKGRIFEETDEFFVDSEITIIDWSNGEWLGLSKRTLHEYFKELTN